MDIAASKHVDLDSPYGEMLRDVPFRPVFVMGDHRSGTTILYKLLGATGCFNLVSVYHVVCSRRLLYDHVHGCAGETRAAINAYFQQQGMQDRVFDKVAAEADMPEEYGYAFSHGGARPQLKPENRAELVALCQKIQLTSGASRPILLKNPWDYFRNFMVVKEAFPDSVFVFIHRYPPQVINSQMLAMQSLLRTRNAYVALVADWYNALFRQPLRLRLTRFLFSSHFDLGLRLAIRHVRRAADYYLENVSSLPAGDYITVRYEDLCADPRATLSSIMHALGLEDFADIDYNGYIKVRDVPLVGELERKWPQVSRSMKLYLDQFGYA
jgi:hypothetical protein